ncbi:MAG: GGDEF domain-containing protein [Acidobacteria bacterium]|nr:MAG: GGDEF domain-containing protein [Acidobacteriota bacterium]
MAKHVFKEPDTAPRVDLREDVAHRLMDRLDIIISDAIVLFPFSAPQPLDADYCSRLGHVLVQLLATAVRDGRVDPRLGLVVNLQRLVAERGLPVERLFNFVYLTERSALDELALADQIGATSESWPLAFQLVRRGSFDLLAAFTDRLQQEPSASAVRDRLTTLYTRAMMDAVLATVLQRAERGRWPVALVVFDVDRLSEINESYGYGVGDRVLERMGIQMRKYFRQEDWVFRHAEDSIAVLLSETNADDAAALARHVLGMVEERLGFRDHHTDSRVQVSVRAAVVAAQHLEGALVDPERMVFEAEAALARAKQTGRSSIERVEITPSTLSLEVAARYLDCAPEAVEKLMPEGAIKNIGGRAPLVDLKSVAEHRKSRKIKDS